MMTVEMMSAQVTSPPSGEQFEIRHGDQRAVVVEVGGGIRVYEVGRRPVLDPYPRHARCDGGHGAVLVPWPNRLADGRCAFDGDEYELPITETDKHNAIHGLLRWRNWEAVEQTGRRVVMASTLHPMPGYPFHLRTEVAYALDDAGLTVTTTATNLGDGTCPYAGGQHPYLSPGEGTIDTATLELHARTRIVTDPRRRLPVGTRAVAGSSFDLSHGSPLAGVVLDDAFTDLDRDDRGRAWVHLGGNDGRAVELWADEAYPVLQLFTGDTLAVDRARRSVAVEPMTAPANALQTGEHLVRLEPGARHRATWGVRLA